MSRFVSFECPYCRFTCGWNAKKQEYDAIPLNDDRDHLQYAHRTCAEQDPARVRLERAAKERGRRVD